MTARSAPHVVSSRIRERQTVASTASMPDARPRRRGQAPKPHSGAPKAQGLTAAITVAAPSHGPSIAPVMRSTPNSTGADASMNAFATSRIYTSLTGTTLPPLWPVAQPVVLLAGEGLVRFVKVGSATLVDLATVRDYMASRPTAQVRQPKAA